MFHFDVDVVKQRMQDLQKEAINHRNNRESQRKNRIKKQNKNRN